MSLRLIQAWLGHTSPRTTTRHTHLTTRLWDGARPTLETLVGPLVGMAPATLSPAPTATVRDPEPPAAP